MREYAKATGIFTVECFDKVGRLLWRDRFSNVVTTVGKNLALDAYLSGSAYTVTGPWLGLISLTGFVAVSVNDTMASHAGWLEAGGAVAPTYDIPRKLVTWSPASGGSKGNSIGLTFAIAVGGSLAGGFIVFGPGAVATVDDTNGTLYSAGQFTGGSQTVATGNIVNVGYTTSL